MICLGMTNDEKIKQIKRYVTDHKITKVIVISPKMLAFDLSLTSAEVEQLDWPKIQAHVVFHRLMSVGITSNTLIVANECLRMKQSKYDLNAQCMSNYLTRTTHKLIFQWFPILEEVDDFRKLFNWETHNKFKATTRATKGSKPPPIEINAEIIQRECRVKVTKRTPKFAAVKVPTPQALKDEYAKQKNELMQAVEASGGDPNTLPRTLSLLGGKAKKAVFEEGKHYLARNGRLGTSVFGQDSYTADTEYELVEFPAKHIDFCDFCTLTGQQSFNVLMTSLKADEWYLNWYNEWAKKVDDAYSAIV